MSLVETRTLPELSAHYKAVRKRLWPPQSPTLPMLTQVPEPETPWMVPSLPEPEFESVAARRREIDERLFGARVMPKSVIAVTADYFGLPVALVRGRSRNRNIADARHVAIYLMHTLCRQVRACGNTLSLVKFSFKQVADHFGLDHSTVIHTLELVRCRMVENEKYATAISDIMALLQRGEKK